MLMRKTLTVAVATLAVAAGASTAQAGPPGKWTQVTGIGQEDLNIMRVGLARTSNGVLTSPPSAASGARACRSGRRDGMCFSMNAAC